MATARLRQIEQALTHALTLKGLLGDVTIKIDSSGLVEGLVADSTFFVTDSAQLSPLGEEIVDTSGHVLDSYPNNVDVAGYTDDQQITGGPFANNWALSAARSSTVVERLTTVDAVNPIASSPSATGSTTRSCPTALRRRRRRTGVSTSSSAASRPRARAWRNERLTDRGPTA